MNIAQLLFCFMTINIIIYGSIINLYEHKIPKFFSRVFRYGKHAAKGGDSKLIIEVPKSWFRHFYVIAVPLCTYVDYLLVAVYVFGTRVPEWLNTFLNLFCGDARIAYTSPSKVLLASFLFTLQIYRRFYDTHYVSVFGKESKLNLTQYIVGLCHYPGTVIAILSESPLFAKTPNFVSFWAFTYWDIFATVLFIWAWWRQYVCTEILANLRKNKKGVVVSDRHRLPEDDLFKYLSAPHQTAEILMYLALSIILWKNTTFYFVFAWVLSNQVETILLSHWWYQETFDNYPRNRKALVPFIY
ncbi:polyprenol reductase [Cylas formicarius]|uniref:polyprenol reductase n=1 Tax=Cylas formicarius TaxID=197179 RepID=UPI002958D58C|nr:polyprenol reductase [Cylas formicarius]